jgi:orotate phosphoribosyltransferase
MYEHKKVLEALKTHSVKVAAPGEGFKLASGGTSRFYIDVKKAALHREVHLSLATLLHDEIDQGTFGTVEAVAGVALGGCHLASIVGLYATMKGKLLLHVIHVRKEAKEHGTKNLVENPIMIPDQPVVLLEDVVTTGGSSVAAIRNLREVGYKVVGTVAVIDRRPLEKRTRTLEGAAFRSLFTLDDFQQ